MSLARTDEVDLVIPLHEGLHETPRWQTFLSRLQRRVGADHVSLVIGHGTAAIHRTAHCVGRDVRAEAVRPEDPARLDPIPCRRLRPGRVYTIDEAIDADDPGKARPGRFVGDAGPHFGRIVRVTAPGDLDGWIVIGRARPDFTAAHGALLSGLAPHLTISLHMFGLLERSRLRAAIADDVLARAGLGWEAFDRADHAIAAGGAAAPAGRRDEADRLSVPPPSGRPAVASGVPARVAIHRVRPRLGETQQAALRTRHGLSRSEAALACALAEGRTLTDAAAALGLTIETARTYSKLLYAKTGAHGQAGLVAWVLRSVAILA